MTTRALGGVVDLGDVDELVVLVRVELLRQKIMLEALEQGGRQLTHVA